MKYTIIFLFNLLCWAIALPASDTLTVEQVRTLAQQNSPLQQQKAYAETQAALRSRNIRSNSLPRIQFSGQATYQSDVFGFPNDNPVFQVPVVPKDQYKAGVDVSQRIWDGNSDKYLRQQQELERMHTLAQTDVDVFQLREAVTSLFFNVLLLQEKEAILTASLTNLQTRQRQAEAAVSGGVALRTAADQVRIQILQTEQQIADTRADQRALKEILAIWIGRSDTEFYLKTASSTLRPLPTSPNRPEYQLFQLQQQRLQLGQDMLRLQAQPRIELFAQAGFGRPNPFNFFETGFEPFGLIGLRAVWTPVDWGNRSREREVLTLQAKMVDAQRQAFDQRLEAATAKDKTDAAKAQALLQQDDAIIALQEDIVRRAEAQVQNGVMTNTDYLSQLNLLTQVKLTRKTHEIQALQAQELLRAKTGDN